MRRIRHTKRSDDRERGDLRRLRSTLRAYRALMEESVLDPRYGHFVNHDLAEYHVPVNADGATAVGGVVHG